MDDALHLHRRICVLRASGHAREAARLESTELSGMLASLSTSVEPAQLASQLTAQAARVADALELAELIAPLLAARLGSSSLAVSSPGYQRVSPARHDTDSAPSIADFIDGMLEQERASARSA